MNKFALDTTTTYDKFHSPDTVCKYCGVDFKFFRNLKNHLRSSAPSSHKPFECQLCCIAFCTKEVCLCHIENAHPEINNNQIENFVKISNIAADSENDSESICSEEGVPLYTEEPGSGFHGNYESTTPQPPAAHSTPRPGSMLGRDGRHISPNRLISPLAHISPAQSPLAKKESRDRSGDRSCDTPLDFSMKSAGSSEDERKDETPMDLSVKKDTPPLLNVPIAPKVGFVILFIMLHVYLVAEC